MSGTLDSNFSSCYLVVRCQILDNSAAATLKGKLCLASRIALSEFIYILYICYESFLISVKKKAHFILAIRVLSSHFCFTSLKNKVHTETWKRMQYDF